MARYLKKKEKKYSPMIWVLGVAIIAIAIAVFVIKNLPQEMNVDVTVETPYCTLYYPEKWSDQVRIDIIETPEYCVSYYAVFPRKDAVSLFNISFGEETENPTGIIQTDGGELMTVSVSVFTPQSHGKLTEEEWNIVQEMKDDLNNILEHIPFVVVPEETEPMQVPETDPVDYKDVQIDTLYGQLTYPGEWQDYLQVTHIQADTYQLSFAAAIDEKPAVPLFDIVFSDNSELGVIYRDGKMIGVSLVIHEFTPDASWTVEQIEIVSAMQEAVNEVVGQLDIKEEPNTDGQEEIEPTQTMPTIVLDETVPEVTGTVEYDPEVTVPVETAPAELIIETPYGQLKYPGKWISQITTEVMDTDSYVVVFYGTIGFHERVHLFSVRFGEALEPTIGAVQDGTGNEVAFDIIASDFTPGDDWGTEERNMLYEMMEDVNYLIFALIGE